MNLRLHAEVPDDKLRLYALLGVVLLEVLAVVALERYVDRGESLPRTPVACRHKPVPDGPVYNYGYNAGSTSVLTTNSEIYWFGTNRP